MLIDNFLFNISNAFDVMNCLFIKKLRWQKQASWRAWSATADLHVVSSHMQLGANWMDVKMAVSIDRPSIGFIGSLSKQLIPQFRSINVTPLIDTLVHQQRFGQA